MFSKLKNKFKGFFGSLISANAASLVQQHAAILEKMQQITANQEQLRQQLTFNQEMIKWLLTDIVFEQRRSSLDHRRLEHFEASVYSQNGEDGVLAEIFNRIGTGGKTFVEFGVGDGMQNNSRFLLQQGWKGLWLEGSERFCEAIRANSAAYLETKRLTLKNCFITKENIDDLIGDVFQGEIDLLSVDIDGNDYYVFDAISCVDPRVIITEYNAKFPPPVELIITYKKDQVWQGDDYYGCSLASWDGLMKKKGYTLVGCELSGTNAFWVRNDLCGEHFPYAKEPADLYHPARYFYYPSRYRGQTTSPMWQESVCGRCK